MTLAHLLDRTVTIRPMNGATSADRYGDDVPSAGADVTIRARRHEHKALEVLDGRDEQIGDFVYIFPPDPAALALTGRDRIIDGGERLEVIGPPNVVTRRRNVSHVEARVRLVEG